MTPYLLGYLVPAIAWLISSPAQAGALTLALCALAWSFAMHRAAARARREPAAAMLACVPFSGVPYQWGLLSFLVGLVVFVVFLDGVRRAIEAPGSLRSWLWPCLATLCVYLTHLLWFGAAVLVSALLVARHRAWRCCLPAALGVLPAVALAIPSTLRVPRDFDNPTVWSFAPLGRMQPWVWGTHAIGPSRDFAPTDLLFLFVALPVGGIWQRRHELDAAARDFLLVGALFFAFTLLLPSRYTNTTLFDARWASPALVFLALGAPIPDLRGRLAPRLAALLLVLASANVTLAWRNVNIDELSGLEVSIAALPPNPRVLGLSFQHESRHVHGAPFVQTFAWAQVRRGGEVNFSFAYFPVMPVVFRQERLGRWTPGLEWHPERVRNGDLLQFDFALIGGGEPVHEQARRVAPFLEPVIVEGSWRLYRVTRTP